MSANEYEERAREAKVAKLVTALYSGAADGHFEKPITAAQLEGWSVKSWAILARIAEVKNPPSAKTRKLVIERVRHDEQDAGVDPFARFGEAS